MSLNITDLMTKPENSPRQNFHRFFDCWLDELNSNLQQLVSAADHHEYDDDDGDLRMLIDKSIGHYDKYYKVKSETTKEDVISMFSPKWLTSLEDAFSWVTGWRPTTAIHLLYSKSGIQLETTLAKHLPVFTSGDLGSLSSDQIRRVDKLQQETIREERNISDKLATLQESAADTSMVYLSSMISEMIRKKDNEVDDCDRRVELALEPKKDEWEKLLNMADNLRTETLKSMIEILTPFQAVNFLIAAAELHLRIHDWGLKKDADYKS